MMRQPTSTEAFEDAVAAHFATRFDVWDANDDTTPEASAFVSSGDTVDGSLQSNGSSAGQTRSLDFTNQATDTVFAFDDQSLLAKGAKLVVSGRIKGNGQWADVVSGREFLITDVAHVEDAEGVTTSIVRLAVSDITWSNTRGVEL